MQAELVLLDCFRLLGLQVGCGLSAGVGGRGAGQPSQLLSLQGELFSVGLMLGDHTTWLAPASGYVGRALAQEME